MSLFSKPKPIEGTWTMEGYEYFDSFYSLWGELTAGPDGIDDSVLEIEEYEKIYDYITDGWPKLVEIGKTVGIDLSKHESTAIQIWENFGRFPNPYDIEDISFPDYDSGEAIRAYVCDQQNKVEAWKDAIADIGKVHFELFLLFRNTNPELASEHKDKAYVFCKKGHYWVVKYQGDFTPLKDDKGMSYIHLLLQNPGKQISCVQLAHPHLIGELLKSRCVTGDEDDYGFDADDFETSEKWGKSGTDSRTILDEEAIKGYKKRLAEIDVVLDQTENGKNTTEQMQLLEEREAIIQQIKNDTFFGRSGKFDDVPEKARKSVRAAIGRAFTSINKELPILYQHLKNSIQTGYSCIYTPEKDIPWEL